MNNPSPLFLCATGEIDGQLAEVNVVVAVEVKIATTSGIPFPEYSELYIEVYHSLIQDGETLWTGSRETIRYQSAVLPVKDDELLDFAIQEIPLSLNRAYRIKLSQPITEVSRNHLMLKLLRSSCPENSLECLYESRSEAVKSLHRDYLTLKGNSQSKKESLGS